MEGRESQCHLKLKKGLSGAGLASHTLYYSERQDEGRGWEVQAGMGPGPGGSHSGPSHCRISSQEEEASEAGETVQQLKLGVVVEGGS